MIEWMKLIKMGIIMKKILRIKKIIIKMKIQKKKIRIMIKKKTIKKEKKR